MCEWMQTHTLVLQKREGFNIKLIGLEWRALALHHPLRSLIFILTVVLQGQQLLDTELV